jgi:DNA polymerase-3 subunit epsilon
MLASAPALPPLDGERSPWFAREHIAASAPGFLERIVVRVPDVAETHEQAEYIALVERCLLDRYLSEHEKDALVALADRLGIGRDTAERLHRDYFLALARVAWADGVVTSEERGDLELVAALLSIGDDLLSDAVSAPPPQPSVALAVGEFLLAPGDEIVLTGEMTHQRSHWEGKLRDAGFVPKSAVTKRVALVVAADPDSLSGKARKARDYGIPIVGEAWLEAFLGSR